MSHTLKSSDLLQFTGSECIYQHALAKRIAYTEGARHVAQHGGAYWLLDEIAFAQATPALAGEPFQTWTLTVANDRSARLVADDGNGRVLLCRDIPWTDFPLQTVALYCCDAIILLPSEY